MGADTYSVLGISILHSEPLELQCAGVSEMPHRIIPIKNTVLARGVYLDRRAAASGIDPLIEYDRTAPNIDTHG